MKYVELVNYTYKFGDDVDSCLRQEEGNAAKALLRYADTLLAAAEVCKEIANIIGAKDVDITADTHHVSVKVTDEVANKLAKAGLGDIVVFDDEQG